MGSDRPPFPRSVSVVMPTYNRAATLTPAVRCVLAQTEELELLVVDDGSTDGTAEVLAALGDERVRVVRQGNQGLCAARNAGLARARHAWVAFVDDDDLWAPGKLACQLDALEADPAARWCIASAVITDEHLHPVLVQVAPPPDEVAARLRHENCVPGGGSGVVVERALLQELGGFDTRLSPVGDWELWLRLGAVGPPAVVRSPQLLYRRHPGQMSAGTDRIVAEVAELVRRGLVDPGARAGTLDVARSATAPSSRRTAALVGRALLARQARSSGGELAAQAEAVAARVREVCGLPAG